MTRGSLLLRGSSGPATAATANDAAAAAVDADAAATSGPSRRGRGRGRRERVLRVPGEGRKRARPLRGVSDAGVGAAGENSVCVN